VAKIGGGRGRIFVHLGETGISVKCGRSRDEADEWLARYPEQARVMPYDGRFGWNSLDYTIPDDELIEAIHDSYRYAVAALPKAQRPTGHDGV
jgi:predicted DNA-binding protein (MmcQ/YjbR family)